MTAPHYALVSHWSIAATRTEVWDALDELLASADPMTWWPSVHVENYDGASMTVRTASPFGYSLTFALRNLSVRRPETLSFTADGDLRGRGAATFVDRTPDGCTMRIDWHVDVDRRWMRWTSWLLRPMFVAGHHVVMRQGEKRLNAWIAQRGSRTAA